jgi:hypothetical protein
MLNIAIKLPFYLSNSAITGFYTLEFHNVAVIYYTYPIGNFLFGGKPA